jgi:FlaA1/EpsC-like NDP-sugar epimerase
MKRVFYILAIDAFLAAIAVYASYALRLEPARFWATPNIYSIAAFAAVISVVAGYTFRSHWILWRFVSVRDVLTLALAAVMISLSIASLAFTEFSPAPIPRSVPIIFCVVYMALVCGVRLFWRMAREFREGRRELIQHRKDNSGNSASKDQQRILLAGSHDQLELFLRANQHLLKDQMTIKGLLTTKKRYVGTRIRGELVIGTVRQVDKVIDEMMPRVDMLTFLDDALQPFHGVSTFEMIEAVRAKGMQVTRIQAAPRVSTGTFRPRFELKDLTIEDVLDRPVRNIERKQAISALAGRTALVTGGGGSVGSELCRQIADSHIGRLVILELSEFNLYQIEMELVKQFPNVEIVPIVGDIRDLNHLCEVFEVYKPDVVFHAAALKHVPLVELNRTEAILTNVLGTKNVVDCCLAGSVQKFVMVSTDKAVSPTSFMGISKRIAELYVSSMARKQKRLSDDEDRTPCQLISVRFGNVLGSSGSVIPLFRQQVARGGPVTLTHQDMERFFMTISEAATLILEGHALLGSDDDLAGATFILDMGEPVKIRQLAEQIISLSGYKPYEEIDVQVTGLRPGEKLFEELHYDDETLVKTDADYVSAAMPTTPLPEDFEQKLTALLKAAEERDDPEKVVTLALKLVPRNLYESVHNDLKKLADGAEPPSAASRTLH